MAARKPKIPVFNGAPVSAPAAVSAPAPAPAPSAPSSSSGGSSSGGSGGSGGDPYGYRSAAGKTYLDQAAALQVQADALVHALRKDFKKGLMGQIANKELVFKEGLKAQQGWYNDRADTLQGSFEDNEKAADSQTNAARSNMLRERNNAVSEAMMQGAGESDLLAAQQMSLRNWNANQSEVNRSLFDTVRSINASLTDLNVDSATARTQLATQFNTDRELLWTNYYNQRSEAFTNLGNTYGAQANAYSSANQYGAGGGGKVKEATNLAADAFMKGAKELGKTWENPGVPKRIRRWEGRDEFTTGNNTNNLKALATVSLDKKPEGATLRQWTS